MTLLEDSGTPTNPRGGGGGALGFRSPTNSGPGAPAPSTPLLAHIKWHETESHLPEWEVHSSIPEWEPMPLHRSNLLQRPAAHAWERKQVDIGFSGYLEWHFIEN